MTKILIGVATIIMVAALYVYALQQFDKSPTVHKPPDTPLIRGISE